MLISEETEIRYCPEDCPHCAWNRAGKAYCRRFHRLLGKHITRVRPATWWAWIKRLGADTEVIRYGRLHKCTESHQVQKE